MFKSKANSLLAEYQLTLKGAKALKKGSTLNHVNEDGTHHKFEVISVGHGGRTVLLKSHRTGVVEYSYRASCAGFIPSQENLIKNILNNVTSLVEDIWSPADESDASTFTFKS